MFKAKLPGLMAGLVLAVSGVAWADDRCRDVTETYYEMGCTYYNSFTHQYSYRVFYMPAPICYQYDPFDGWAQLWSSHVRTVHQETYQECDPYPEARMHVHQNPESALGMNPVTMSGNNSIGVDLTYEWTYTRAHQTLTGTGPSFSIQTPGGYTATIHLKITDKHGDISTASQTVFIHRWIGNGGPIH